MYHRIADEMTDPWDSCVSPRHFGDHLAILSEHATLLPLREVIAGLKDGRLPPRTVAITFDDGYADNLYNAKPILERNAAPATVFVINEGIGRRREFWWDELEHLFLQPGRLPSELHIKISGLAYHWHLADEAIYTESQWQQHRHWRYDKRPPGIRQLLCRKLHALLIKLSKKARRDVMEHLFAWARQVPMCRESHRSMTPGELLELGKGGLVEIGAHTLSHPLLSRLSPTRQFEEIRMSRMQLEVLLGPGVFGFSYPFGNYAAESVGIVRDAGFHYACAVTNNPLAINNNLYELPRVCVSDWPASIFAQKMRNGFQI